MTNQEVQDLRLKSSWESYDHQGEFSFDMTVKNEVEETEGLDCVSIYASEWYATVWVDLNAKRLATDGVARCELWLNVQHGISDDMDWPYDQEREDRAIIPLSEQEAAAAVLLSKEELFAKYAQVFSFVDYFVRDAEFQPTIWNKEAVTE